MLQTLEITGYTCNCLRLLSQNSFEDIELPVRVENCRCKCGLSKLTDKHGLKFVQFLSFLTEFSMVKRAIFNLHQVLIRIVSSAMNAI